MKHSLLCLILFSFTAQASEAVKRCKIHVTQTLKSGRIQIRTYPKAVPTKEECETLAEDFKENFSPQTVKEKKVAVEWKG